MITEPSKTSRDFLRMKAATEAALRRSLKGTTKRQRREAIARASVRPSNLPLVEAIELQRGRG